MDKVSNSANVGAAACHEHQHEFNTLLTQMEKSLTVVLSTERTSSQIYAVNTRGLSTIYLNAFDDENVRQEHNCSKCLDFIRQVGGAVVVNDDGAVVPLWWCVDAGEGIYAKPIAALAKEVKGRSLKGIFKIEATENHRQNAPDAKGFEHFNVLNLFDREQHGFVTDGLTHRPDVNGAMFGQWVKKLLAVDRAHVKYIHLLLQEGDLQRGEDFEPVTEALLEILDVRDNMKNNRARLFAMWAEGFGAIRGVWGSVIGTVIDLRGDGASIDHIKGIWQDMTTGINYMRPSAEITARQTELAEQKVREAGYMPNMSRRPATVEEVLQNPMWVPEDVAEAEEPMAANPFDALKEKPTEEETVEMGLKVVSAKHFLEEVLPKAKRMRVRAGYDRLRRVRLPIGFATRAVGEIEKPIAVRTKNNPLDLLFGTWHNGAYWDITDEPWVQVRGVIEVNDGVSCAVANYEAEPKQGPACLFPEAIVRELYPHRKVVEKLSNSQTLNLTEEHAALIHFASGMEIEVSAPEWQRVYRIGSEV